MHDTRGQTRIFVRFRTSNLFKINRIAACIVCSILSAFTVFLNTIAALTIKKYPSLKKKMSYYLLYLQSLMHFLVGTVSIPIYTFVIARKISTNTSYPLSFVLLRTVTIPIALSNAIILLVSFERYVMLLYSNFHCNKLNKKILGQILTIFGTLQP